MIRAGLLATLLAALVLAGCGSTEPRPVPDVTGLALDEAEARLDAHGLDHSVSGGGAFGVILRSRWQVCEQVPQAGATASDVTLVVDRACSRLPSSRAAVVPDVEYERLDEAEEELADAGLGYVVVSDDEVIVRSSWTVCDQDPEPGRWAATVELTVARDCWDW